MGTNECCAGLLLVLPHSVENRSRRMLRVLFSFPIGLLSSQDSELLWNHVPWLLERNQEIAVKVN